MIAKRVYHRCKEASNREDSGNNNGQPRLMENRGSKKEGAINHLKIRNISNKATPKNVASESRFAIFAKSEEASAKVNQQDSKTSNKEGNGQVLANEVGNQNKKHSVKASDIKLGKVRDSSKVVHANNKVDISPVGETTKAQTKEPNKYTLGQVALKPVASPSPPSTKSKSASSTKSKT